MAVRRSSGSFVIFPIFGTRSTVFCSGKILHCSPCVLWDFMITFFYVYFHATIFTSSVDMRVLFWIYGTVLQKINFQDNPYIQSECSELYIIFLQILK